MSDVSAAQRSHRRRWIGTVEVPCVSRAAQRAMHLGYELPEEHEHDLALIGEQPS